jgi:hypothetical protein
MIDAADNVGHTHVMIIDNHGKIVSWVAIRTQDDEIIEVLVGNDHASLRVILDHRLALLRGLEADDRLEARRRRGRITVTPCAVIADGPLFSLGLGAHGLEFGRRAVAVISFAALQ